MYRKRKIEDKSTKPLFCDTLVFYQECRYPVTTHIGDEGSSYSGKTHVYINLCFSNFLTKSWYLSLILPYITWVTTIGVSPICRFNFIKEKKLGRILWNLVPATNRVLQILKILQIVKNLCLTTASTNIVFTRSVNQHLRKETKRNYSSDFKIISFFLP